MKVFFVVFYLLMIHLHAQISDFKHVDFTKADNIAALYKGEKLNNLPLLSYQLTHKLSTDVQKFRAIYRWVCGNIKNDHRAFLTINRKRKKYHNDSVAFRNWHSNFKKKLFKNLAKNKKTICTGYAYIIKELSFIAGIECEIVDGYARNVSSNIDELTMANHSWNAVKLNNKWYLCDATWSSGFFNEEFTFFNDFNDGYFLTNPDFFSKNHFPLDKKWLLNSKQTEKHFITSPLVYDTTFEFKINPILPESLYIEIQQNELINFEYQILDNINLKDFELIYYSNNQEKKLNIHAKNITNNIIRLSSRFSKIGYFDIHAKVKGEIICSYSIQVQKNTI